VYFPSFQFDRYLLGIYVADLNSGFSFHMSTYAFLLYFFDQLILTSTNSSKFGDIPHLKVSWPFKEKIIF